MPQNPKKLVNQHDIDIFMYFTIKSLAETLFCNSEVAYLHFYATSYSCDSATIPWMVAPEIYPSNQARNPAQPWGGNSGRNETKTFCGNDNSVNMLRWFGQHLGEKPFGFRCCMRRLEKYRRKTSVRMNSPYFQGEAPYGHQNREDEYQVSWVSWTRSSYA